MKKYPTLILIAGLAVLLLTQQKVVLPLVYDVIKSRLFLVDSKDEGGQKPISTEMSVIAFNHCNNYIKSDVAPKSAIIFTQKPQSAWSLGNYQYLITAEAQIGSDAAHYTSKKYVCRINYNNGDNTEGASDLKNWTILGITGLT